MLGRDPRKCERILGEADYERLTGWVTWFFENNYALPAIKEPIARINTSQGNIIYTFVSLFDELEGKVTRPDALFELIRACFTEFRNKKIDNMKRNTTMPQYYSQLTRKI